jgi:hypothetical protein
VGSSRSRYIGWMRVVSPLLDRVTGRTYRRAVMAELHAIRERVDSLADVLFALNHEVRSGAPETLPLFVGFAEAVRTDAESAIAASVLVDRQIRRLEARAREAPPSADQ